MTEPTPTPQQIADEARRLYTAGDFNAAAGAFQRAAEAFADARDPLEAAEMKNNQCVALLRVPLPEAALAVVQGTEKVFGEAGDQRRAGMALANQASALEALKRKDEAIQCYRLAAAALEQANEGDLRAEVMQLLSVHYLRRGKFYDAILALQSGLAGAKNPTPRQKLFKKILFMRLWR
ncbi:MAG: hypothetical protein JXB85_08390 [Anaerolineales bacterium]|nr:hypothetical protein [Anaerolineales bacterium]